MLGLIVYLPSLESIFLIILLFLLVLDICRGYLRSSTVKKAHSNIGLPVL